VNKINKSINTLEKFVNDPKKGLPTNMFYFIGRMTPYINVDLLIYSKIYGTLLTWREDPHTGNGWHIPGGIIRFKEKIERRIFKVGKTELGINISKFEGPIEINQIINNNKERSHFISLLYNCKLNRKELKKLLVICKKNNKIKFFKKPPKNLLRFHNIYKDYF